MATNNDSSKAPAAPAPATSEQQELVSALAAAAGITLGNLDGLTAAGAAALIDGLKATIAAR